ncbi:MAG: aspartate aminotransferase family protein, partial [Deltaproteobacteria bacterium]|nr:aspartate aminotransferase family protein [Candidatus Tharpella sp.]
MNSEEIFALTENYIAPTYNRFPLALVKGEGVKLWDAEGNEYLDCLAGIAVCNLGHCHPQVSAAIASQAARLMHVSNLYHIEPQARLAKLLCELSFAEKVFFCNSGAEANEAAIKLARRYGNEILGEGAMHIITMHHSFHGRTMATITATGQKKVQTGYQPLLAGFDYVPFNDIEAVAAAITKKTCAVLVEPVQGEGGVILPAVDYLNRLRALCDERGVLLIFDEVQTGIGRTGAFFAYQHSAIAPDIMTAAKALGNGFPIGAMLASDRVMRHFGPGSHASTFGGNPLASAAALATLETLRDEGIVDNVAKTGAFLIDGLKRLKQSFPEIIGEIRGLGLMVGVDLRVPVAEIVGACLKHRLLVGSAGDNTLRITPPLIIEKAEIETLLQILTEVLTDVENRQ